MTSSFLRRFKVSVFRRPRHDVRRREHACHRVIHRKNGSRFYVLFPVLFEVLFPVRLDALSRHRLPKKLGNLSHAKTTELTEKRRDAALATTDKSHASSLRSLREKMKRFLVIIMGPNNKRRKRHFDEMRRVVARRRTRVWQKQHSLVEVYGKRRRRRLRVAVMMMMMPSSSCSSSSSSSSIYLLLFLRRRKILLSLLPTLRSNQNCQRYRCDRKDVNEPIHSIPRP